MLLNGHSAFTDPLRLYMVSSKMKDIPSTQIIWIALYLSASM